MEKLIFFVDDDKMMLNLLEYTLTSREGYAIKTFYSGEDCLKNMELNPDLIVLDYMFTSNGSEHLNGLETLKKIKEISATVPVIILTSQEDSELQKEFFNHGAAGYIPKNDYFIDALIDTIEARFN